MRHQVILLVASLLWCQVALAKGRITDSVINVIQTLKKRHLESEKERILSLQDSYLSKSLSNDRRLISLALGVHFLETDFNLADQYLTDAAKVTAEEDDLVPIIRFFLAQAKLKAGLFSDSATILENLLARQTNNAWRKVILGFLIENYFETQNYDRLAQKFRQYSDSFTFGKRQESLARLAIEAYEKRSDFTNALDVLEELARSYPITENSRWAFRRLVGYTCDLPGQPHYDFSENLLLAISRNSVIDSGIKDLIVNLVFGRIRLDKKGVKYLTADERAELFFRLRFYDQAAIENQTLYENAVQRGDRISQAHYSFQTGRSYFRQHDMLKSSEWFSRFIVENSQHLLLNKAHELLGDSLKYLGFHRLASGLFGISVSLKKDKFVEWERFWSTYRSGDLRAALSLLEGKNEIAIRPSDDPHSVTYWRGRILRRIGKIRESNAKHQSILLTAGDSYYANLVAIQRPELLNSPNVAQGRDFQRQETAETSKISLAARPIAEHRSSVYPIKIRSELQVIDDLLRVGLREIASMQLAGIKWTNYNQEEAFASVSRLAWLLGDYQASRRIRTLNFSQLRNLPTSFKDYISHQSRNLEDWKIYYPLAFNEIVDPVAKSVEIDPLFVLSVMRTESFYNKEARSPVGALGLMQLMPYTAVKIASSLKDISFDISDLLVPEINIGYGGYYLGRLIRYYGGNLYVAAAAYNAGPEAVKLWLNGCNLCATDEFVEMIPYRETRRYVREVMKTYSNYRRVYLNQPFLQNLPPIPQNLPSEEIF